MNNTSKFLLIGAIAFALGLTMNNIASSSTPDSFSVAVVDIQKIVENSPQVGALRTEQKNKFNELKSFVDTAKAELAKETDAAKKKALEESYNKELNVKKSAIDKEYAKKLSDIDLNISNVIKEKAKEANYDLVLSKNIVFSGGTDITNEITKTLK